MSYEICVLNPLLGDTKEAANQAWNDCSYFDDSKVDGDRSAPKWHTRQALAALNPRLKWQEPKSPATGFFASLLKKTPSETKALIASLPVDDSSASFYVYDQAIEIDLPWALKTTHASDVVRDLWRHLECLSSLGFTAIYDTERDVMLNLQTDFDAVVARYIKNLSDDDDASTVAKQSGSTPTAATENVAASASAHDKSIAGNQSFTGNVGDSKPWWKP